MTAKPLNAVTRSLTALPSRRHVLHGLAGAGLGLTALLDWPAGEAGIEARKKRKHKPKKGKQKKKPQPSPPPPFNAFGCLDVGQPCQGDSSLCCSGVCEPGTSTCVPHNSGICFPDTDGCTGAPLACNPNNTNCTCLLTIGNAAFCGDFTGFDDFDEICRLCSKDTDCQEEYGPGAACVVLAGACSSLCPATGRTACLPPCA